MKEPNSIDLPNDSPQQSTEIPAEILSMAEKSLRELPLSDDARQEAVSGFERLFPEHLSYLVKTVVLMSALGLFRRSDAAYFRSQNVPEHDWDDLTQDVDEKLLAYLRRRWARGNIGALRAATRATVVADYWRRSSSPNHNLESLGADLDTVPEECNRSESDEEERERMRHQMWEIIKSMPEEDRKVASVLATGQSLKKAIRDLQLSDSEREITMRFQEALGPLEPPPDSRPRRKKRKKTLSTLRSVSSNNSRSASVES